ncbi:hypothetical protein ACFL67_03625 [candidate division KSB1 bacterium]
MTADTRTIDNEGQGIVVVAFDIESTAGVYSLTEDDIGNPVALAANSEISDGADDETFLGKLLGVTDDGTAGLVQIRGICTGLPYSGTAPVLGWPVQMSGAGTVDKGITDGSTRGFTLNVDTTAATCDVLL